MKRQLARRVPGTAYQLQNETAVNGRYAEPLIGFDLIGFDLIMLRSDSISTNRLCTDRFRSNSISTYRLCNDRLRSGSISTDRLCNDRLTADRIRNIGL